MSDEEIAALTGEVYALATLPDSETSKGRPKRKHFDPTDFASEIVVAKGILPDSASLERLVAALAGEKGALIEAAALNVARAAGDYRTPRAEFPERPDRTPAATGSRSKGLRLSELVDRFLAAAHPRIKQITKERYRPALLDFVAGKMC